MFKQKEKLIFALILFSCIFLGMSLVVCANNSIADYYSYNQGHDASIIMNAQNKSDNVLNDDSFNKDDGHVNPVTPDEILYPSFTNNSSVINLKDNNNFSKGIDGKIKKVSPKIIAKNKVFNKKAKTKNYSVVLKNKDGKVVKNVWITLKIKNKVFKVKTNKYGKATFKIKKLNKKGIYKGIITFKENKCYNKSSKNVKIIVK